MEIFYADALMNQTSNFTIINFTKNYQLLSLNQRKTLIQYVLVLIVLLIALTGILGHKLHKIKTNQEDYLHERIDVPIYNESDFQAKLKGEKQVKAQVFMWNQNDINMKDKYLNMTAFVELHYNESDFKDQPPQIGVYNGRLNSADLIRHSASQGVVTEYYKVNADVEPHWNVQLYPLDKELVSIRLTPKDMQNDYYFTIVEFNDITEGAQANYNLLKTGFYNVVQSREDLGLISYSKPNIGMNRAYMLFEHKSVYSYLKSIQYILLSIFIAVFSLLVNAKTNSPKNGRVAVIGSSIFALAANAFQLNSTAKPIIGITVIDLMTFFCGILILLCFLITVRTLRFLDDEGYLMSKLFDQAMFICIFTCSIIFFTAIYVYA